MRELLREGGFQVGQVVKILGPLEKISMLLAVWVYGLLNKRNDRKTKDGPHMVGYWGTYLFKIANMFYMAPVWIEAKLLPRSFSTVLMIVGHRANQHTMKPR